MDKYKRLKENECIVSHQSADIRSLILHPSISDGVPASDVHL